MSETLRDLVVSLSLNSDKFTRNIKSINKQIQEAESAFRLASAGVENFETTTAGLSLKLSTLCKFVRCWLQRMCIIMLMEHSAPLQEGNRSCSVPIQRFDAIRPPSAEQIERCFIHFLAELRLHQRCQTIYLLAHVRISAGDVVILYATEIKHGSVPSRTLR